MTLVLTCLTPNLVVQASDRRLTFPDGSHRETLTKATVFGGRCVIAYTGVAKIFENGWQTTEDWILREITKGTDFSLFGGIAAHLNDRLHAIFKTAVGQAMPSDPGLEIVMGSWTRESAARDELRPVAVAATNLRDGSGNMRTATDVRKSPEDFVILEARIDPNKEPRVAIVDSGAQLDADQQQDVARLVYYAEERGSHPLEIGEILVDRIRLVASGNGEVGTSINVTFFPRSAVGRSQALVIPPSPDAIGTAHYRDENDKTWTMPNFVQAVPPNSET